MYFEILSIHKKKQFNKESENLVLLIKLQGMHFSARMVQRMKVWMLLFKPPPSQQFIYVVVHDRASERISILLFSHLFFVQEVLYGSSSFLSNFYDNIFYRYLLKHPVIGSFLEMEINDLKKRNIRGEKFKILKKYSFATYVWLCH